MKRVLYAVPFLFAACNGEAPVGSLAQTVIDGDETPEGLYPATGALITGGQVMCTGTLLSPTVVLTAAHCVDPLFTGGSTPSFTLELDGNQAGGALYAGAASFQHPDFSLYETPSDGIGQWFDIAVLTLTDPVAGVEFARLPSQAEADRALIAETELNIVGYGLSENGNQNFGVKMHGTSTLVEVGTHELFIGIPGEQQNCNGDSGGPAYLEIVGDGPRVVGVVSRAPDQNPTCDHGGIDTRVDPYVAWIVEVAPSLCDDLDCSGDDGVPRPHPPADEEDDDDDQPGGVGPGESESEDGGCRAAGSGSAGSALLLLALLLCGRRRSRR